MQSAWFVGTNLLNPCLSIDSYGCSVRTCLKHFNYDNPLTGKETFMKNRDSGVVDFTLLDVIRKHWLISSAIGLAIALILLFILRG